MEVFWTNNAILQRDHIFDYWNNRNQSKAFSRKLNLSINQNIEVLQLAPFVGKQIENLESRILVIRNYSLIYEIDTHKIFILSFWDNRQDPKTLLKHLKKDLS